MAYYNLENEENAILNIQRILRELDFFENNVARVKPSGIYDDDTRSLVRSFQEKYGLEATGALDKATWDLLISIDKARRDATTLARAVHIFPMFEEYEIVPGDRDNIVFVIQHMLNEIRNDHDDISEIALTGTYDLPTQNAIKTLQRKNLMDENAVINALTFNMLADEYERINSRIF